MKSQITLPLMILSILAASAAHADVGMGLRVGTLGYGGDVDISLLKKLDVRVGYNAFSYSHSIDDTDITYDGKLKLSNASALLDWHPFASGFRLSIGAMGPGLSIDVKGKPTPGGFYDIGNGAYTSTQIGSLNGELKFGNSIAPYVGLGWGNAVGKNHRVTFLFDFGAAYIGKSKLTLAATCGASLSTAQCTALQAQLKSDIALEQHDIEDSTGAVEWWPVIQFGLGVRF